ncbi:hypothetical protein BGX38DRAFT_842189 [Terfezia claveryi]|nr:hypothetical protein BGX38DRAFT_842189 [Terfezia claveryi]
MMGIGDCGWRGLGGSWKSHTYPTFFFLPLFLFLLPCYMNDNVNETLSSTLENDVWALGTSVVISFFFFFVCFSMIPGTRGAGGRGKGKYITRGPSLSSLPFSLLVWELPPSKECWIFA